jgi:hypothetical protein
MKNYLFAGLMATALFTPAFAQSKFFAESPEDPLHGRAVIASMVLLIVLRLIKPTERPTGAM